MFLLPFVNLKREKWIICGTIPYSISYIPEYDTVTRVHKTLGYFYGLPPCGRSGGFAHGE